MNVIDTPFFRRDLRRLAKKHPSIISEIRTVKKALMENPQMGQSIGMNCYKIRLAIPSKGVGKRGGARLITYVQLSHETIHFLSIYDKAEQSDITDKTILNIIKEIED